MQLQICMSICCFYLKLTILVPISHFIEQRQMLLYYMHTRNLSFIFQCISERKSTVGTRERFFKNVQI